MNTFTQFIAWITLAGSAMHVAAESAPLKLKTGNKQTLDIPNAFAEFSKSPSVVRASIADGTVTIECIAAGEGEIVLVTAGQGRQVVPVKCIAAGRLQTDKQAPPRAIPAKPTVPEAQAQSTAEPEIAEKKQPAPVASLNPTDKTVLAVSPSGNSMQAHAAEPELSNPETKISLPATSAPLRMPVGEAVKLRELTHVLVPASQVSAAYSLDPLIAEAQMVDGHVNIWGRAPGKAVVMLVHNDFSTSGMQVTVTQAPPILPESVWSGLNASGRDSKGYYEARVSSNPLQVNDIFDYHAKRMELHFSNAVIPSQTLPGGSTTWFPFSYFRVRGDRWKLTLVDENVDSSPISINSTIVRGVHFSAGDLTVHAGYTSVAGFQSLFLPTRKQLISGATFAHHISADSQVGATGYYIQRDSLLSHTQLAQAVGTLFFRKHTLHGTDLAAEVGLSDGVGGAASFAHHGEADQFHISARYRPRHYAATDVDSLNGLQSESRWDHIWNSHFASAISGSDTHIYTLSGAQSIAVGNGTLRYKASNGISLSSGASVSSFSDDHALFSDVHRFAVPLGISYDRAQFGLGAQYELSKTTRAFSPGQAYRGSIRWSGPRFQMSANAGLDTQALGIDSVFSAFPALNTELARLGLGAATSPDQLATLLQNRAFLNSLGVAPGAVLQLVPRNWHGGANLSWRSGRQILEMDSNYNLNRFLTQKTTSVLQTVRYRWGLTRSTELSTSFTMLETIAPTRQITPIWEVGLRHQLGDNPFAHLHQQEGSIMGTVRLQDSSGTKVLRDAQITLDGERKAVSDSQGNYHFAKVRQGLHTVEITFKSSRPFWYSTPSKVSAAADSVVDFGIIYPSAQLIGYVLDDAGAGLPEIGVLVKGPQGELNFKTDQAGKFDVPIAQVGTYTASVNAATVPDGYAFEDLAPSSIPVAEGESKKVSFTLPAIRALSGAVVAYDPAKGEYVPVPHATVELVELNRRTVTDNAGHYSFRNLPSGTFTVQVNGQGYNRVSFSGMPQMLHHDIQFTRSAYAAGGQ